MIADHDIFCTEIIPRAFIEGVDEKGKKWTNSVDS